VQLLGPTFGVVSLAVGSQSRRDARDHNGRISSLLDAILYDERRQCFLSGHTARDVFRVYVARLPEQHDESGHLRRVQSGVPKSL